MVPTLFFMPFGAFFLFHFSSIPSMREQALFVIDEMLMILPPMGAVLWGYLFSGNVFERARSSFLIRGRHYLSAILMRASLPLLLFVVGCVGMSALFAPESIGEIISLALRTVTLVVLILTIIMLCSYFGNAAFVGVVLATVVTLFLYGANLGWLFVLPRWSTIEGGYDFVAYILSALTLASLLLIMLVCGERWVRRA